MTFDTFVYCNKLQFRSQQDVGNLRFCAYSRRGLEMSKLKSQLIAVMHRAYYRNDIIAVKTMALALDVIDQDRVALKRSDHPDDATGGVEVGKVGFGDVLDAAAIIRNKLNAV